MDASQTNNYCDCDDPEIKIGSTVNLIGYPKGSYKAKELKEIIMKTFEHELWSTDRGERCLNRIPRYSNYRYHAFEWTRDSCCDEYRSTNKPKLVKTTRAYYESLSKLSKH